MSEENNLREILKNNRQEHLLRFSNELSEDEKKELFNDIRGINLKEANDFFKKANNFQEQQGKLDSVLKPVPSSVHGSVKGTQPDKLKEYELNGLKEINEGRVCALLLAGGQGTRLGVSYPKGMYDVGLPSKKTLFQIQGERIFKLQKLANEVFSKNGVIPWYIMTSKATNASTKSYFEENNYFGLDKKNVIFFEQGMLPCFDFEGNMLLEKKNKIAKAPDGNGGLYRALADCNILEDMEKRGIQFIHTYCVDNILTKVCDPVFIGFYLTKKADCGAKVVEKVIPTEPIGVFAEVDGVLQVIEYSEMSQSTAEKRNPDKTLVFNAGNICNHIFKFDFLKDFCLNKEKEMKLHIAKKKIPHTDESGKYIKPDKPNGIKIEKFIFDVFPFGSNFVIWEVPRNEDFSPLKNSVDSDKDNPNTAKQDIYNLHKMYIEKAGGNVVGNGPIEISPLLSYSGEGLEKLCNQKTFTCPINLSN